MTATRSIYPCPICGKPKKSKHARSCGKAECREVAYLQGNQPGRYVDEVEEVLAARTETVGPVRFFDFGR